MDLGLVLESYENLIGLLNLKSLTPKKVGWVFKILNVPLDDVGVEIVYDMLTQAGIRKNTDSVLEVLQDGEFLREIQQIASKITTKAIESGASNDDEEVHVDSLITCIHCGGRNHIRTCIERSESIKHNNNMIEGDGYDYN
jgi:hypothetical protein